MGNRQSAKLETPISKVDQQASAILAEQPLSENDESQRDLDAEGNHPDSEHVTGDDEAAFDKDQVDGGEELDDSVFYQRMAQNRCCGCMLKKFPRSCVFLMGVVAPLLLLIVLSLIFGIILARLEAPEEVAANNQVLQQRLIANRTGTILKNIAEDIPIVCFQAYLTGIGASPPLEVFEELLLRNAIEFRTQNEQLLLNQSESANFTDVYDFMMKCGARAREYADSHYLKTVESYDLVADLSFNWIRCYPGAHDLQLDFKGDMRRLSAREPERQLLFYTKNWNDQYHRLYKEYLEEINATTVPQLFEASNRATADATGGDKCYINGSGSAWFWFTVETTIGYGNQAPVTRGGRILVYTAGFLSILAFGTVLATAGQIILALFDDYFTRDSKWLSFLTKPWWACMLWGGFYLLWMLLIASLAKHWKENRVDQIMSYSDAYWFAFISTTTVGLGDFFLEPEAVVGIDLFYFPLVMLIGFTFLSAFLGKLAELLTLLLKRDNKSFIDTLLSHMAEEQHVRKERLSEQNN